MRAIEDQPVQGLELWQYEDGSSNRVSLVAEFVVSFHVGQLQAAGEPCGMVWVH
jgi:hypothetical protein